LVYHVINRGNKREAVFHKKGDYFCFVRLLKEYSERFNLKLYHWVLMPNHYHLLLEIDQPEHISACMAGINRSYTCYYHKTYSTAGFLWQGRFKLQPVQRETHMLACGRYIERNPVRSGMVCQAQDYEFSSARFYCSNKEDGLTVADPWFGEFGQDNNVRRLAYQEFLSNFHSAEEELFRRLEVPQGSQEFVRRLGREHGRFIPRRRGRPKQVIVS
jgi:putative transposase